MIDQPHRFKLTRTPTVQFRIDKLANDELHTGYDVLRAVAKWLEDQGRKQRIGQTTIQQYERWQKAKSNYAVYDGQRIVGVFTLLKQSLSHWPTAGIEAPVWWLSALATHPNHRGQGIGSFAVSHTLEFIGHGNPLYLDCVSDVLPEYYQALGFIPIARQTQNWPDGQKFDVTLMRHPNWSPTAHHRSL